MKNYKFNYKSIAQRDARDLAQVTPDVASRTAQERLDNGPAMARLLSRIAPVTPRIWKYAAMLLMVLTVGVGQMWG